MDKQLFEKIGGSQKVAQIIDRFYELVTQDPALSKFFEHSSIEKIVSMQNQFFSIALGGTTDYGGRSLSEAHRGRGIRREHVTAFTEHLLTALKDADVDSLDANEIIARIATYADEVLGESTVDG